MTKDTSIELGIHSFGELVTNADGRSAETVHDQFHQIIELARLDNAGGLDAISLGEHHRSDFSSSAPEILLSAIASVMTKLRPTGGVTVLSSQDAVRVFE